MSKISIEKFDKIFRPNNISKKGKSNHYNEDSDCTQAQQTNLSKSPNGYYSQIKVNNIMNSRNIPKKHTVNNYKGCLLGGAIGDALGWPIEFRSLHEIKRRYGEEGITDLELSGESAEITDDTQMTIFTADGLLKSTLANGGNTDKLPDMNIVYDSYQDWLNTQYGRPNTDNKGWIASIDSLYNMRAPGNTCMGSLRNGIPGSIENHINESKGCGGVMRVAPAGLMFYKNPKLAFETGARCAALTHGSASAYLPAGVHACVIANLIQGKSLDEAVNNSIDILKQYEGHEDTLKLIEKAKQYAKSSIDSETAIKDIGEGWHGDEAIAISLYCALKSPDDFESALKMSVNHNGDSDSTGAITGNILGAYLGADKIPSKWKNSVELSSELQKLALDLYHKPNEIDNSKEKYPV